MLALFHIVLCFCICYSSIHSISAYFPDNCEDISRKLIYQLRCRRHNVCSTLEVMGVAQTKWFWYLRRTRAPLTADSRSHTVPDRRTFQKKRLKASVISGWIMEKLQKWYSIYGVPFKNYLIISPDCFVYNLLCNPLYSIFYQRDTC